MIDAAICDGDFVVVREQHTAVNGDIVAALLDGEATVKTFRKDKGHVWLMPHNPAYSPIDGTYAHHHGKGCHRPAKVVSLTSTTAQFEAPATRRGFVVTALTANGTEKQSHLLCRKGQIMAHTHTTSRVEGNQQRLMATLAVTVTVFIIEVVAAFITDSLALLTDAGHMLTDVSVLVASTITAILMRRKPNSTRTWGWARLGHHRRMRCAGVLLFVGIYALFEACMRLFGDSEAAISDVRLLLFVGILGLVANIVSITILSSQREDNMNMKAAFLEVMNDALGSVAVVASALVMLTTGWDKSSTRSPAASSH